MYILVKRSEISEYLPAYFCANLQLYALIYEILKYRYRIELSRERHIRSHGINPVRR